MHIQRLTHLGICVSDLERSLRFYRDVLGCKEVGRLEMEGGMADIVNELEGVEVRAIYLERDGWRLELISFPEPGCVGALNTNGDATVDIADPVSLLNFLFGGGPIITGPYPDCGPGTLPADETLGCASPPDCQ